MRILTLFVFAAALCALVSCGTKETKSDGPVIEYTTKTFHVDSGCKGDSIPCATFDVTYPVFTGLSAIADSSLVKKIEQATGAENPESEGKSLEEMGKDFIKQFEEFNKEADEDFPATGWMTNTTVVVDVLTDTLIGLSVNSEFFTGGAHGGTGTSYINLDPQSGHIITLNDVLKPGFNDALTQAGEKAFRIVRELEPTDTLSSLGFEFPDDKFQLNQNYGFKKEGIAFFFNNYEIGPYALGPTEIIIPYEEIKDWLKR